MGAGIGASTGEASLGGILGGGIGGAIGGALTANSGAILNPTQARVFGGLSGGLAGVCLLYTSPSPRDQRGSRMPSSA